MPSHGLFMMVLRGRGLEDVQLPTSGSRIQDLLLVCRWSTAQEACLIQKLPPGNCAEPPTYLGTYGLPQAHVGQRIIKAETQLFGLSTLQAGSFPCQDIRFQSSTIVLCSESAVQPRMWPISFVLARRGPAGQSSDVEYRVDMGHSSITSSIHRASADVYQDMELQTQRLTDPRGYLVFPLLMRSNIPRCNKMG